MKKTLIAMICVATAAAVSCTDKENLDPGNTSRVKMEFSAGTPALTKTAIADNGQSVVWSEKDEIGIFDGQINKFILMDGAGTSSATFTGVALPDVDYYAIYPYDDAATMTENTITATLPSVQYSTADGTFDTMLNPAVAKADASGTLVFDHVAAMLKINIEGVDSDVKSIALSADKSLAGEYTVDMSQESYTATVVQTETVSGVELKAEGEGNLAAGPYWLVVLPGSYTDVELTVTMADGTVARGSIASLDMEARDIVETTVTAEDFPQPFGFTATEDVSFSYKGATKTYKVNASAGTAWTLSADSDDAVIEPANGTGSAEVKVTLPYSKYIYDKDYILTLAADGEENQTLTISQESFIDFRMSDVTPENGTLTASGTDVLVKAKDVFKYGEFVWKFSGINLTSGFFLVNNWASDGVYLMIRFGNGVATMSAGGTVTLPGGYVTNFGFDGGWNNGSGSNAWNTTLNFTEGTYPEVNAMTEFKIVMKPTQRSGTNQNNTLSRQVFINGTMVLDNSTNVGDVWQAGSPQQGIPYEFGIGGLEDYPANGTMTIESFEYIPLSE